MTNVEITPEELAIVRRLIAVRDEAHEVYLGDNADGIDEMALFYGFFLGAGAPPKRAYDFALLACYEDWLSDPVFATAVPA